MECILLEVKRHIAHIKIALIHVLISGVASIGAVARGGAATSGSTIRRRTWLGLRSLGELDHERLEGTLGNVTVEGVNSSHSRGVRLKTNKTNTSGSSGAGVDKDLGRHNATIRLE